ncbi:hypothetical protein J2X83_005817 [Brevibacillus nitrificans]|nr:hypothetical protein [Brevibacillus nitrificans]
MTQLTEHGGNVPPMIGSVVDDVLDNLTVGNMNGSHLCKELLHPDRFAQKSL